jgi:16S rRNA (guanine(966)-N(2))-methyltransferase RsmD
MATKGLHIIAGERRGWKLESPRGKDITRPITGRVKENLFNIIRPRVDDAVVLDLFAGTGSLGLEALSRGARWVTFVEQHRDVVPILKHNIARLRYEEQSRVIQGDALRLRPGVRDTGLTALGEPLTFSLVFADPPYRMLDDDLLRERVGQGLAGLLSFGALASDALIVVRRDAHVRGDYPWPEFRQTQSRKYGSMVLDFLRPAGDDADRVIEEP